MRLVLWRGPRAASFSLKTWAIYNPAFEFKDPVEGAELEFQRMVEFEYESQLLDALGVADVEQIPPQVFDAAMTAEDMLAWLERSFAALH